MNAKPSDVPPAARSPWAGRAACRLWLAALALLPGPSGVGAAAGPGETRYLLFQVFTAAAQPEQAMGATVALREVPSRKTLETFVGNIRARVGTNWT